MNDLSIHGQFSSTIEFFNSVDALMAIRQKILGAGRELFCHRGLRDAQVTADLKMAQAVQGMSAEKKRAWLQWLTKEGPHWEDHRQHTSDDWLETDGEPITGHAIGEAAYCKTHGSYRELVSAAPSGWLRTPIIVTWRKSDEATVDVHLTNHWSLPTVTTTLQDLPTPFDSWQSLENHARRTCDKLTLSNTAFDGLKGYPYVRSVADGIFKLINVLNKLNASFDESGRRTSDFESLYETYFIGEDPYFTDESVPNKREFKTQLTFHHPTMPGETLFCPWHGKVNSPKNFPKIRIHFTWPAVFRTTLYVVHVGPKITMR